MLSVTCPDRDLSSRLLAGLARFRATGARGPLRHDRNLFSYCAVERERFAEMQLGFPVLGIVLSGRKEVWRGEFGTVLTEGTVFVLPAESALTILNLPDERRGSYQSLVVRVEPDMLARSGLPARLAARLPAGLEAAPALPAPEAVSPEIRLTPHLVETLLHAASDIGEGAADQVIRRSRLTELLALLAEDPAGRPLFALSLRDRLELVFAEDLARPWTAPAVARRLGLSESTLRRRLAGVGTSFRAVLREARMNAAHRLLSEGYGSQQAGLAVGYASRAHFARHVREAFGANPLEIRTGEIRTGEIRTGEIRTGEIRTGRPAP